MTQGVKEKIGSFPSIEPKGHFVQIGREMLGADLVPRSNDSALQQRERGFDGVGMNVAVNIMTAAVIDSFVALASDAGFLHRKRVGAVIVRDHDLYISAHVLADVLRQRARLGIFGVKESQITVSLSKADHDLFVPSPSAPNTALLAADIGFVHFDSTVKHGLFYFLHRSTDAMTEIPRRLVGAFVLAPDCAFELMGTHAFLCFAKQQHSEKPLLQWQMGIVEDRASHDGELVVTTFAVEQLLFGFQFHGRHLAARAFNSTGPAQPDEQLAAFFVSVEKVNNVN